MCHGRLQIGERDMVPFPVCAAAVGNPPLCRCRAPTGLLASWDKAQAQCCPLRLHRGLLVQGNAGWLGNLQAGCWTSRHAASERSSDMMHCLMLTVMDPARPPSSSFPCVGVSPVILASIVRKSTIPQQTGTPLVFQQDWRESPAGVYWFSLFPCTLWHPPLPRICSQRDFGGYTKKRTLYRFPLASFRALPAARVDITLLIFKIKIARR